MKMRQQRRGPNSTADFSARAGSVLMEFVIVAPLYLLLLGGLFLVADLAVNKLRMHIGDELVTWVGASRFCPQDASRSRDSSKVASLLTPLFERSIGGAVIGFKVNSVEETDAVRWNDFMSCYSGGIVKLPINIPGWVRGMMSISDLLSGKSNSEWLDQSSIDIKCDYPRVRVFHRHALTGIDIESDPSDAASRDRAIAACDVVVRGYLDNVLDGQWIHLDGGNDGTGLSLQIPQEITHGRMLGVFGE